ncbi:PREDICTED: proprotein convertase subtilisin/kexin type 7 [Cyprinodon variegatus]|uniref:proprotein convertase subtilisin/kexin type 7 n=1 Tax=Cyprinodon variegatus TaxID=28743 RepID=UPI00074285AD|nr:PREDICTED: proprotein convertase subtilisin/kexin type 7 [Cyprinodon variegatus]
MAAPYFPTFLLLIFVSSLGLLLLTLLPAVSPSHPLTTSSLSSSWPSCGPGQSWAVRIHHSHEEEDDERAGSVHLDVIADKVAKQAGLQNQGQIGELEGHYLLCSVKADTGYFGGIWKRSVQPADVLATHPHVLWFSKERVLSRSKRALAFNDPNYPKQWHLHNKMNKGMDINVTGVWEHNITGQGVTVVVVDDGVEHTHQDIKLNYSPEGSYDLNSNDPDPMPHPDFHSDNHHGTRCAGEIAAVPNNSFCAVGVAYGSKVAGIRVLDGPLTDRLEAIAFNKHYQINDIYSCSWGPDDDGHTVDGPHPIIQAALQHGVIAGRRGFGSIFVVASGNGGQYDDNCNYDGYANSIYTITIGAVDEEGRKPFYAEDCASLLAVTFSSGGAKSRNIVTSDWSIRNRKGCTEGHTGTSAAAPLAAGMVALMLQVRPCLTWRDVQHIVAFTATQCDSTADWGVNDAGFHHSHQHGFGLLNAWRLVNAAKVWESVPFLVSYQSPVINEGVSISAHPDVLVRTWNGTVFIFSLSHHFSSVDSCLSSLHISLHNRTIPPFLPPCMPAAQAAFLFSLLIQFLLLLGCFALFWSLYYILDVTLGQTNLRGLLCLPRKRSRQRTGHVGKVRGTEEVYQEVYQEDQDSGVEAVSDVEVKVPITREHLET